MPRKSKALDIWKEMKPASLRRLSFAVFFMFGTLGPLMILMQSSLETLSWSFIIVQTICSGGIAASLVLFGRKRWWITFIIIMFWTGMFLVNSGEFSVGYYDHEGFRVRLGELAKKDLSRNSTQAITLQPEQLNDIYTQKAQLGLCAVAMFVFGYISFIKVLRVEVGQRARFETEVKIARDIQQSLLPEAFFQTSWCSISGATIPATEVGGDYFDVVQLSDSLIAVAIADVTGHGVGAGILSAMTKSAFHSQLQHNTSPVAVVENLNKTLYQLSDEKTFVTFAYALIDHSTQSAGISTAGHQPLLHKHLTTVRQHRTASLGLGIQQQAQFTSLELPFTAGDYLMLYTDGVVETANAKGEQFGIERLEQLFSAKAGSAEEICASIVSTLRNFSGTDEFQDDVSIVCVKL